MSDIPADALHETWDSVYAKSVELAHTIEAHCRETGEQFDALLVVPRGAFYPANIVSRELGFGAADILQAAVGSYEDQQTGRADFKVGQMPSADDVRGKDILIIEEVCESGHTLHFVTEYLKKQGAGLVRCGVLHHKPSLSQTGFEPDWSVLTTDKWIVYPWEEHEAAGANSTAHRRAPK